MAELNQLDPLVDLDSLFETDLKQSSGNEIEEDICWNVFLINNAANDFCVSFPKDLRNNQKEHDILYSKLIKTDDQQTYLLLATSQLKEPQTFNVEFLTNDLWKIDEKPNVFDQSSSYSLFMVQVPIPSFKCGDIVKASFKLVADNGSVMTSSKSIIYEKDGSNSARLIYGPSLDNEKLQINSINEIELLKRYFSLLNF